MSGALAGFRVLDLSEDISGPYGAKLLADLGADVVKVEAPGRGDRARLAGPFPNDLPSINASGRFLAMNLGKRSVTLDITTASGRNLLHRLIDTANAVVQSVPPNPLGRAGIDEKIRADRWPDLVVTTVSPLGMNGPDSGRSETELTLASRSSWISQFGEPDREPLAYPGTQIALLAGVQVALATLAGLVLAEQHGSGQWIDISQVEANTMAFDQDLLGSAFVPGRKRTRVGRRTLRFPPRLFPVSDGYVSMLVTDNQWPRFCRMCDFEDYARDPELRTQTGRANRMEELEAAFIPWFLERTKFEVVERGQKLGVPIAPFNTIVELLHDPHFVARGSFVDIETEGSAVTTMPGRPFVLSGTAWSVRRPAPALGEHTAEVLGEIGLSPAAVVALSIAGVI